MLKSSSSRVDATKRISGGQEESKSYGKHLVDSSRACRYLNNQGKLGGDVKAKASFTA
jgi:hypothetical protein